MLKIVRRLAFVALAVALPAAALAAPDAGVQAVRQTLARLLPGHVPDTVAATPVPGLYRVRYGMQVFYISGDGRYLLRGDLIDLRSHTNLTQAAERSARMRTLAALPADTLLTYRPEGKVEHVIYVFSDIDCPYCRRLHAEVPELNGRGVEVRYLFFPRSGLGTPSARKAESVWCAKNRDRAYDRAMAGEAVAPASCANPVARDFNLGVEMGVQGTPTIVLSDGRVLPGYVPASALLQAIRQADGSS